MIVQLSRFLENERPYWEELERMLEGIEKDPLARRPLDELRRFHYLYERASADLARVATFASEPELRRYLEWLVARGYSQIHDVRERRRSFKPWRWLTVIFPRTFRRHSRAFALSVALTLAGCAFGVLAMRIDADAKSVLMPFEGLQQRPRDRVAKEEKEKSDRLQGRKQYFSAFLMTHNTQVAITAMALGMTWGIGTIVVLFHNGVVLGAVAWDYILDGQARFLLGWLLPHGAIEIPSILIAGQCGLVLAGALIGHGSRKTRQQRLLEAAPDIVTLIGGTALLLVWAGLVEAFLSQYHEPVLPYSLKIMFGLVELALLSLFLARAGRGSPDANDR